MMRSEHGSAALGLIATVAAGALALACVGTSVVFASQSHLQHRVETLALAGADALSGRVAGYACENVKRMALDEGITLRECRAFELELRVIASQTVGGFDLTARAHAGPEKSQPNLTSR